MTDDFLLRLQSATDLDERQWLVTENLLNSLPTDLCQMAWAAALPHWFDANLLAALRPDLKERATELYAQLQALPFVEPFERRGYNIHELTRRLMLEHLWQNRRAEYVALSKNAALYFARLTDPMLQVEHIYHLLIANPDKGTEAVVKQGFTWHDAIDYTKLNALARAVREHAEAGRAPARAIDWGKYWEGGNTSRLNVFALPRQTTILAGLIATVLLGSIWIGSINSAIPIWPLALCMLVLPIRAILARPEREIARYGLSGAGDEFKELRQTIEATAKQMRLRRVPRLMVSKKLSVIYTFDSFRHWYIAVGWNYAQALEQELNNPDTAPAAQAKVIHELYHFKTGDYWQLGYVEELLRSTFQVMSWAAIFLTGWGLLLVLAGHYFLSLEPSRLADRIEALTPEIRQFLIQLFPSAEFIEEMRQKAASIDLELVLSLIVQATLPFIVLSGVLRIIYRPKLWRMHEFYADAWTVQTQGDTLAFKSALSGIPLSSLRRSEEGLSSIARPVDRRKTFGDRVAQTWKSIRSLLEFWPSSLDRIDSVSYPPRIFDSWKNTAVLVGSLTLLLNILLTSPLTLLYVGGLPLHFSTLVMLVAISLSLIPRLIQGKPVGADILKIIGITMGLQLAWMLFTIGLLVILLRVSPYTLDGMLRFGVAAIAHYAGTVDTGFSDLGTFVVKAAFINLSQVVNALVVLLVALFGIAWALRRLLTWYRFPHAEKWLMRAALGIIGWMALVLAFLVLPISTGLLLNPLDLFSQVGLVTTVMGSVIFVLGVGAFVWADRQYGGICPRYGHALQGPYRLGRCCPACNERLHPWLIAEYKT